MVIAARDAVKRVWNQLVWNILPLALLGAQAMVHADFYVSTAGNDSWSGSLPSPNSEATDGPFATLERARNAIRALKNADNMPANGITVWIRGGSYFRDKTFELLSQDSGTRGAPVIYSGYTNEQVRLIGGKRLTGFTAVTNASVLARLGPNARSNVVQTDLRAQGISNLGSLSRRGFNLPGWSGQMELFLDSSPMVLARWPNTGWLKIAPSPAPTSHSFACPENRPGGWADTSDVWLHGYWGRDWTDNCERMASYNPSTRVISIEPPGPVFGYAANQRFYFFNVLEELDSPGEYYIDRTSGILYFWPATGIPSSSTPIVSTLECVLHFNGVSHTQFKNITIEVATADLVRIDNGRENALDACTLRNNARIGVSMLNTVGSGVIGCEIYNIGDKAINIYAGDRNSLSAATNYVVGNHIYNFSRLNRTYRSAATIYGVGHRVANNLIHDAPHCALEIYGNGHTIEYNEIYRVCTETADAGAIYMSSDWTFRGTMIRYNYFHDLAKDPSVPDHEGVTAVYLDNHISGTTVFGNVFHNTERGVFVNGGRDNMIDNNIFVNCEMYSIRLDQFGLAWPGGVIPTLLLNNLNAVPYQTTPWSTAYPSLVNILNDEPAKAKGNVIRRNIRYGGNWLKFLRQGESVAAVESNNFVTGDPLFVDQANGDFRLRTNSPAWTSGFQPIPLSKIGLLPPPPKRLRVAAGR